MPILSDCVAKCPPALATITPKSPPACEIWLDATANYHCCPSLPRQDHQLVYWAAGVSHTTRWASMRAQSPTSQGCCSWTPRMLMPFSTEGHHMTAWASTTRLWLTTPGRWIWMHPLHPLGCREVWPPSVLSHAPHVRLLGRCSSPCTWLQKILTCRHQAGLLLLRARKLPVRQTCSIGGEASSCNVVLSRNPL